MNSARCALFYSIHPLILYACIVFSSSCLWMSFNKIMWYLKAYSWIPKYINCFSTYKINVFDSDHSNFIPTTNEKKNNVLCEAETLWPCKQHSIHEMGTLNYTRKMKWTNEREKKTQNISARSVFVNFIAVVSLHSVCTLLVLAIVVSGNVMLSFEISQFLICFSFICSWFIFSLPIFLQFIRTCPN